MLSRLIRTGLRKGLVGGSRPWLMIGVTAAFMAIVRRVVQQPPETVFTTPLRPGDALEVRVLPPESGGVRQ